MTYKFEIHPQALKRKFSVYVVVAVRRKEKLLYVGKTGDNREGCNPVVSRCGNHFSYNKAHSQLRNKIPAHEEWSYTYVFDHFNSYCEDLARRKKRIDRINEIERWVNLEIQAIMGKGFVRLLNPYCARGHVSSGEIKKRLAFRTAGARKKVRGIVATVKKILAL